MDKTDIRGWVVVVVPVAGFTVEWLTNSEINKTITKYKIEETKKNLSQKKIRVQNRVKRSKITLLLLSLK